MKIYYRILIRGSIALGIILTKLHGIMSTLCLICFSNSIGEMYTSNVKIKELIQLNLPYIGFYIGIDSIKFCL